MKFLRRSTALLLALAMALTLLGHGFPLRASAAGDNDLITVSDVYVNPLYADVITEEDLSQPQLPQVALASEEEYLTSPEELGKVIREYWKDRVESFTVYYQMPRETYDNGGHSAFIDEAWSYAMQHTGVPTEGDYLKWQYGSRSGSGSVHSTTVDGVSVVQISMTYTMTFYTSAEQEREMDTAVADLLDSMDFTNRTDYQKLCLIYDYICENVTYDYTNLENSEYKLKYTAYAALINGTSVCQGYAVLLYRLALELGIDCRLIAGTGNGGNHGWNIAELNELYYNLDATWDAGNNPSAYRYYLKATKNFGDHIRNEEYDNEEFHAAYPMSSTDYVPTSEDGCTSHTYDSGTVTTPATCTAAGVKTYTCTSCGHTYTETISATGHDYQSAVTAPTCTEGGYTTYTCSVCGDHYTADETSATGHSWSAWTQTKAPTCTETGTETRTCSECDASETRDAEAAGHDYQAVVTQPTCTAKGYTTYTCSVCCDSYVSDETDALGHSWDDGVVTKEATEDEAGIMTYTCGTCGETKTETIPELGHTHSYTATVTAPTCTEKGYTTHTCSCGDSYISDETDALGHSWDDGVVTKAASEDETGIMTYTCGTCGETKTETIPALGHEHSYTATVTAPTCTEKGYTTYTCSCGDSYVSDETDALGHSWDEGTVTTAPSADEPGITTYTCTVCGATREESTTLGGICGENAAWTLDQGTLTISGTGAMYDYVQNEEDGTIAPWMEYKDSITAVIVEDGITQVGSYAFYKCLSLTSVTIADSVTELGDSAFDSCYYLEQIGLSSNLVSIGYKTFYMCDNLTSIQLPDSLTSIGGWAFKECTGLTSIEIPEGIEVIPEQAFANCMKLTAVSFPSTLKRIENAAFSAAFSSSDVDASIQLTLPEGLELIGSRAFMGASNITGVTIPNTVTTIEECAFASAGLLSVTIPESVTTMDTCAFSTDTLTEITFQGDAPAIGEDCFSGATATAYYPAGNTTWTEDVMQNYGGTLTWVAYNVPGTVDITRLSGKTRYDTAFAVADQLKEVLGVETFDTIVVAYGRNFADALAGSYLATQLDAPILLTEDSQHSNVLDYIQENLSSTGKVYILGGDAAVSLAFEDSLSGAGIHYERLSGKTRYDTNLAILQKAGLNGKDILVCTGQNFADSLSASAVNMPILLVNSSTNKLTTTQEEYLETLESCTFHIIGGTGAVSAELADALAAYGTVERISGKDREATSVAVANTFFTSPNTVALAYSRNFPDGLCGGPLAYNLGAPLLLVNSGAESYAAAYVEENSIETGIILGGSTAVSDDTVSAVFGN